MDDLIKLVKTYRLTAGIADRLRLAEEIFRLIEPDLRLFVFGAIRPPAAEDVLQEVLKAAANGMKKFAGGTNEEFWAWCYRIARNKLNDHFRAKATDREHPMPQDELWQLVESSAENSPLSPADRHDLEYAMKLLTASKPECYDYLWKHFVFGLAYGEIAEEQHLSYDPNANSFCLPAKRYLYRHHLPPFGCTHKNSPPPSETLNGVALGFRLRIALSIDDYEMPYLRVLMDEVCGRGQFIAANVWQKRYSRENRESIGDVHEYVVLYAKSRETFKEIRNLLPLTEEQKKVYKNPTNDPRGPWRTIPITAQAGHATKAQFYTITAPSGKKFDPSPGNCWRYTAPVFEKLRAEGRIYFGKDGNGQPNTIRYLSEVEGTVPWTWWPHEEVGNTDEAKKEMLSLFKKEALFETPKPERLIYRILSIATNPGDLVLDSFGGSGTTAVVAQKIGRPWIMVELGEHCHTHIIPRLQKVIDGTDAVGITEAVGWKGGGGFRYYRLAPSLLKTDKWGNLVINKEFNPDMLSEAVCKLEGYTYAPSDMLYWQHGHSVDKSFIYVTTQHLTREQLTHLNDEVGSGRSLLICCAAFRGKPEQYPHLEIKKIPKAVLVKCEWGHDDYSLKIENLPKAPPPKGQQQLF